MSTNIVTQEAPVINPVGFSRSTYIGAGLADNTILDLPVSTPIKVTRRAIDPNPNGGYIGDPAMPPERGTAKYVNPIYVAATPTTMSERVTLMRGSEYDQNCID